MGTTASRIKDDMTEDRGGGGERGDERPRPVYDDWDEWSSGVEPIRPHRSLFVRRVRLGGGAPRRVSWNVKARDPEEEEEDKDHRAATEVDGNRPVTEPRVLQLVCVHGTCGTETQFHALLQHWHQQLCHENEERRHRGPSSSSSPYSTVVVDCLLYDWLGCGQSPIPTSHATSSSKSSFVAAFHDDETRADVVALCQRYLNETDPVVLIGHSYAFNVLAPLFHTSRDHSSSPTSLSLAHRRYRWAAFVWLCAGMRDDEQQLPYPDGGPWLLSALPVWLLDCLQPVLTRDFLQRAVSPTSMTTTITTTTATAGSTPMTTTLYESLRAANQRNSMAVVQAYYSHHHWVTPREMLGASSSSSSSLRPSTPSTLFAQQPHLVLHGADDGILPPAAGLALARALQAIPRVRHDAAMTTVAEPTSSSSLPSRVEVVLVDHTRHLVMMERPDTVATALRQFLHAHDVAA